MRRLWFISVVVAMLVIAISMWLKSLGITEDSLPPALSLCLKIIAIIGVYNMLCINLIVTNIKINE